MSLQSNKTGILPIAGTENSNRDLDILFIHGLGGDALSTWQYENNNKYFWPQALISDFPNIGIWTIGYGATASSWVEDVMSMEDRTENLLNLLSLKNIGKKPFVLIAHSMGGLIAKYILTQAAQSNNPNYQAIANNCQGIVFLAVPHNGSGWSNVLDYTRIIVRGNEIVRQLSKDSSSLRQLNNNFTQLSNRQGYDCYAFFETKEVRVRKKIFWFIPFSKGIKVVSESSASGSFLKEPAIPMDDDHLSICKLQSKEDQLYKNILRIINTYLTSCSEANANKETSIQPSLPKSHTIQKKITEIDLSRNKNRLDRLYNQLEAMQKEYDLETRVEEKMRLEPRIEAKQNDINKILQEVDK